MTVQPFSSTSITHPDASHSPLLIRGRHLAHLVYYGHRLVMQLYGSVRGNQRSSRESDVLLQRFRRLLQEVLIGLPRTRLLLLSPVLGFSWSSSLCLGINRSLCFTLPSHAQSKTMFSTKCPRSPLPRMTANCKFTGICPTKHGTSDRAKYTFIYSDEAIKRS